MKNIFYVAGGLLLLTGVLRLVSVLASPVPVGSVIGTVFAGGIGVAYLVIGYLLIRQRDSAVPWAVIVPAIGLLLTLFGGRAGQDTFTTAFLLIDVLVVGMCAYLLVAGQGKIGRVR